MRNGVFGWSTKYSDSYGIPVFGSLKHVLVRCTMDVWDLFLAMLSALFSDRFDTTSCM